MTEEDFHAELIAERFGARRVAERHIGASKSREGAMSPAQRSAEVAKALAPRRKVYGVARHDEGDHD